MGFKKAVLKSKVPKAKPLSNPPVKKSKVTYA
jgi:hypothetical protein